MNQKRSAPPADPIKVSLIAWVWSFVPLVVFGIAGFMLTAMFAFGFVDFVWPLIAGLVIGTVVGIVLSARHLHKNAVTNATLIAVLSTSFNVVLSPAGGAVAFVVLTMLLGKDEKQAAR